jgi:hypothetical protein
VSWLIPAQCRGIAFGKRFSRCNLMRRHIVGSNNIYRCGLKSKALSGKALGRVDGSSGVQTIALSANTLHPTLHPKIYTA